MYSTLEVYNKLKSLTYLTLTPSLACSRNKQVGICDRIWENPPYGLAHNFRYGRFFVTMYYNIDNLLLTKMDTLTFVIRGTAVTANKFHERVHYKQKYTCMSDKRHNGSYSVRSTLLGRPA